MHWLLALLTAVAAPLVLASPAAAAQNGAAPAVPRASWLAIATIPPTPAARFALDGQALVTDDRGIARVLVPPSTAPHRIELTTPTIRGDVVTSRFVRWHGQDDVEQGHSPVLDGVHIDHRLTLRVAFEETRSLRFSFVDQAHHPVDPSRIGSVTVRSDTNRSQSFPGTAAVELVTTHPGAGDGPPVAKESTYSLQSVTIDGANVVNVGEQRFRPTRDDPVLEVVVLLTSVHLRVQDRLLGRPVPTTVRIAYPDGTSHDVATDGAGELVLQNMARGTYTITALGQAYAVEQKLALSRSQFADIAVVTYRDLAIVGGCLLAATVALVWVGVRRTRRHRAVAAWRASAAQRATAVRRTPAGRPAGAVEAEPRAVEPVEPVRSR
jgi:hypothetical protein